MKRWSRRRGEFLSEDCPSALSRWTSLAFKTLLQLAALALVILFFRYLWIAFNVPVPTTEEAAKVVGTGKDDLLKELEEPKRRFKQAGDERPQKTGPKLVPGRAAHTAADGTAGTGARFASQPQSPSESGRAATRQD